MSEPAVAPGVEIRRESAPEALAAVHRAMLAGLVAYNHEQAGDSAQAPLVLRPGVQPNAALRLPSTPRSSAVSAARIAHLARTTRRRTGAFGDTPIS